METTAAMLLICSRLIEQGSKAVSQMMSTLFFPVVPFVLHIFVIASFLTIAVLLSSVRSPHSAIYYKSGEDIVGNMTTPPQCNPGACLNPETNATFLFNDTCSVSSFVKANCDMTECQEEVKSCLAASISFNETMTCITGALSVRQL